MTPQVLIRNVRLYGEGDPVDVLLGDEQILAVGPGLDADANVEILDGTDRILLPGFVDLHTHLREPGREDTETIDSGSAAAARGGYTAVFAMANTDPVADSAVVTDHVWRRGQEVGLVDVHPVGAVTVGLQGRQLAEMGSMASGIGQVKLFSDDGKCVDDPLLMRRALEYSFIGEKVTAEQLNEVFDRLRTQHPEIFAEAFLTCLPSLPPNEIPHYKFVLIRDSDIHFNTDVLASHCDQLLSQLNCEYNNKRRIGSLAPARFIQTKPAAFAERFVNSWETQFKFLPLYQRTWE